MQPEFFVRDATGGQFGDYVQFGFEKMVVGAVYTICTQTFFFTYTVVQRVVTGY